MTTSSRVGARVAICSVLRNERRYLLEWIAHHRLLGVERFLLFDNESDDGSGLLLDALQAQGLATVMPWPGRGGVRQLDAFQAGARALSFESDFVAFLDLDEFLMTETGNSLPGFLARTPVDVGALAICQKVFGSAGRTRFEPDLVTARFTLRAPDERDEHRWVKTIVRPEFVQYFTSPHSVALSFGRYAMTDGRAFVATTHPGAGDRISHGHISLNHYMLKSREEFAAKQRRGAFSDTSAALRFEDAYFSARDPGCDVADLAAASRANDVRAEILHMIQSFPADLRRIVRDDLSL